MSRQGWTEEPAEAAPSRKGWTEAPATLVTGKAERAAQNTSLLDSMGPAQRFLAGAGGGLMNVARNVQDITTPIGPAAFRQAAGAPTPQRWADERQAAGLVGDTGAGMVGNITGEILPTIPFGAGAAGAMEAIVPRVAPRVIAALLPLMAEGATQGALVAEPGQRGAAAATGGALGAGFGLLGKAGQMAASKFGGIANRAAAAAEALGIKGAAKVTAQARSAAGREAQELYRTLEHLRELAGRATPEAQQELEALAKRGIDPASIEAKLHAKSAAKLGSDVAAADETAAAYREAMASEPQLAEQMGQEAAKSSIGQDALSLFKSYGEPILGAAGGYLVGDKFGHEGIGATLGSLIFGRARAAKAIRNKLAKPGNQIAAARFMESLLGGTGRVVGSSSSLPMAASPRMVSELPAFLPSYAQRQGSQEGARLADLIQASYPMTANAEDR